MKTAAVARGTEIEADTPRERLDRLLARRLPDLSRSRLKALIESSAYARDYSDITIAKQQLVAGPALKLAGLVEVYSSTDFPDLNAGVVDTMKKLQAFVDRNKLNITGPAQVQVTLKERYRLGYTVTLPVDRNDVPMRDEVEAVQSLGGEALVAEHVGERRKSNVTFEKLQT